MLSKLRPLLYLLAAATLVQGQEPYVAPTPRVRTTTLNLFVVDATQVAAVDIPLWGPGALTQVRIVARAQAEGLAVNRVGTATFAMASGEARILDLDPRQLRVEAFTEHAGTFRLHGVLVGRDPQGGPIQVGTVEATATVAAQGRFTFQLVATPAGDEALKGPCQLRDVALLDLDRIRVADEVAVLGLIHASAPVKGPQPPRREKDLREESKE